MIKRLTFLIFLVLNINTFTAPTSVKDPRMLYLIQETKKDVTNKLKNSNLDNKNHLITQLNTIDFLEKNLGRDSTIGMEIYQLGNKWTEKLMFFNPKYYNLDDDEISYNIKYQFTVFLVYFYLNTPPKTKGDIKSSKNFQHLAKIIDFDLEYSPKIKKYKGEIPVEDARVLYLIDEVQKEVQNKIKNSNLPDKNIILENLENINAYKSTYNIDSNDNLLDIKMSQVSYGNKNNSQTKWVDKRIVLQEKSYFFPTYILKPSIELQFARFIYSFSYNYDKFDEDKFLYICDIVGVNPKDPYKLPKYPNETLLNDKRILYYLDFVHKESIDRISKSNLKDKKHLIEQFEYINAYRTKNQGNKIAEMITNKKSFESYSLDGKKLLKTDFYDNKRILFREKAFKLNDDALLNTIKHEFAHALVSFNYSYEPKDDHGKEFKAMCKILGVDPKYSQAVVPMTEDDML